MDNMADFRPRTCSLTSSFLVKSSDTRRRCSLDVDVLKCKQKLTDFAISCRTAFSEKKTSLSSLIDDVRSLGEKSLGEVHSFLSSKHRATDIGQHHDMEEGDEKITDGKEVEEGLNKTHLCRTAEIKGVDVRIIHTSSIKNCNEILTASPFHDEGSESAVCPNTVEKSRLKSRQKCTEWMSKIPEEILQHSLSMTAPVFGNSPSSMKRNDEEYKTSGTCQKSVHSEYLPEFHSTADTNMSCSKNKVADSTCAEELPLRVCYMTDVIGTQNKESFLNNEQSEMLYTDIMYATIKVLNEIDIEMLKRIVEQTDVAEQSDEENSSLDTAKSCANVVPDCERRCKYSPHLNRKYSTSAIDISPLEADFINMKTDLFTRCTTVPDIHVGVIDISIQYLVVTKRLKVTIEGVRNLQQLNKTSDVIVSVSVIRKTKQKEKWSEISRGHEHIHFNSDLFFGKISLEDVHLLCLTFNVYKTSRFLTLKRKKCVGECFVYLDNLDVVGKVQISKSLMACQ